MDLIPLLQKMLGVVAAGACGATLVAFLLWVANYFDTSSGFMGTNRDWAPLAALVGAGLGCVAGVLVGSVVVLTGAGETMGALVGLLVMLLATVPVFPIVEDWRYALAIILMPAAGAVVGVVASSAPSWVSSEALAASLSLRIILGVVEAAPFVLLLVAVGVRAKRVHVRKETLRRDRELVAVLERANVEVTLKDARVLSDDGSRVQAEVTLQIRNVPLSLPYYEMNIHDVGSGEAYYVGAHSGGNLVGTPYLRVSNVGGRWVFSDYFTGERISDDDENLTLRFWFTRQRARPGELPETITPRLGVWDRDDKVYTGVHLFFYKPLPVSFIADLGLRNPA